MSSLFDVTAGSLIGPTTGGTVTQATNKGTGVTLNTQSGQITMNNAALADAAEVSFTVTNSKIAATDVVVACHGSAGLLALTLSVLMALQLDHLRSQFLMFLVVHSVRLLLLTLLLLRVHQANGYVRI